MPKHKILVIDDDEALSFVVKTYLENDGYHVYPAHTGADALNIQNNERCDAILLDLGLPDTDGFSMIPRLKGITQSPIIVVSGKEDTTDKVVGLELGADDYITKPFEMRELSARVKAALRRNPPQAVNMPEKGETGPNEKIHFEDWILDRSQYQVFDLKGAAMDLTSGEFRLLEALVMAPNRVLSREQLFDLTREATFDGYDRAVDIQIGRIRKKFDDNPSNPRVIKTIRGIGYMFCGHVKKSA